MSSKKLVSVALTATTVIWALGIAALPLANAQSTSDLQAQISALLAQISQLQAQLNGSSSGSSMTYDFTTDLTVGSTGADVSSLQQLLISKGFLPYCSLGSDRLLWVFDPGSCREVPGSERNHSCSRILWS
jgi:hypothetical protein